MRTGVTKPSNLRNVSGLVAKSYCDVVTFGVFVLICISLLGFYTLPCRISSLTFESYLTLKYYGPFARPCFVCLCFSFCVILINLTLFNYVWNSLLLNTWSRNNSTIHVITQLILLAVYETFYIIVKVLMSVCVIQIICETTSNFHLLVEFYLYTFVSLLLYLYFMFLNTLWIYKVIINS